MVHGKLIKNCKGTQNAWESLKQLQEWRKHKGSLYKCSLLPWEVLRSDTPPP